MRLFTPKLPGMSRAGDVSGLHHFESHLAAFRDHLELEVGKLVTSAQQLTDDSNWWTDTDQVGVDSVSSDQPAVP